MPLHTKIRDIFNQEANMIKQSSLSPKLKEYKIRKLTSIYNSIKDYDSSKFTPKIFNTEIRFPNLNNIFNKLKDTSNGSYIEQSILKSYNKDGERIIDERSYVKQNNKLIKNKNTRTIIDQNGNKKIYTIPVATRPKLGGMTKYYLKK